jgi:hypothetical protein
MSEVIEDIERKTAERIMSEVIEDIERKTAERIKTTFDTWMDKPMTQMCLSMIPASERPEALLMLLKSAYEEGFRSGQGHMVGSLFEHMVRKPPQ